MGFPRRPRPRPTQGSSSESSSQQTGGSSQRSSKRLRLADDGIFNPDYVKVFFVEAKLTPEELRSYVGLAKDNGATVVSRAEEATVVLSRTKVWNRLKKYLPDGAYVCDIATLCPSVSKAKMVCARNGRTLFP